MAAWLGHENRVVTGGVAVSSQISALPGLNLQTPHSDTSSAWQTAPGVTTVTLRIDGGDESATWQMFGLFRTNLSATARIRWTVGSADWLNNGAAATYDSGLNPANAYPGYNQAVHIASTVKTARYCRASIVDTDNPDGFILIAQAFAGPGYRIRGISPQSTWSREPSRDLIETRGGQQFATLKFVRRAWDVTFPSTPNAEVYPQVAEAMRAAERGQNVLFVPFADGDINRDAVFGLMEASGGVGYANGAGLRRTWRARFTERL